MSEFVVEKRAEADTLINQALLDTLNEIKEKEGGVGDKGRKLILTPSFKDHEGRLDLNFLRDHLSDVKAIVKGAIVRYSASAQRAHLERFAEPMLKYLNRELSREVENPSGHRDVDSPTPPTDNLAPRNGLEDGKEQDGNERQPDIERSDKKRLDRTSEVDRLINEITSVYTMPEDEAGKSFDNIKKSLKIGWGNKVLKTLLDDGWEIETIDHAIYGVEGYEKKVDDFRVALDLPYAIFPKVKKIYYRLGLEDEDRVIGSSNNVLSAIWEAFFKTYGAHIINRTDIKSVLEKDGIDFDEEGYGDPVEKIIGYLTEVSITYATSPEEAKRDFPNVFKIIDGLVKEKVSPNPVTENDVNKLIANRISRKFNTNEKQLPEWQQQAIDRYRKQLTYVDPDILKNLALKGVRIHFIDGLVFDHPMYRAVPARQLPSPDDRQVAEGATTGSTIVQRIFPLEYENENKGAHLTSRVTTLHELGHVIENTLYFGPNRPSQRPEFKKIMEDDLKKEESLRTFKDNDHIYEDSEEYFAQALAFYLAKYATVKGDKDYNQILREENLELYNYIEKEVEEIKNKSKKEVEEVKSKS